MAELYTDLGDGIISCNACGAHATDGNPEHIHHCTTCGGLAEVEKWERYYDEFNQAEEETADVN
jgi:hypothetical protein